VAQPDAEGYFYRTSGGAEIDLLLRLPNNQLWAVDIKRRLSPRPELGSHAAGEDLAPARTFVVYPGDEAYRSAADTQIISLPELARLVAGGTG
jgi:hypothetical protein